MASSGGTVAVIQEINMDDPALCLVMHDMIFRPGLLVSPEDATPIVIIKTTGSNLLLMKHNDKTVAY